MTIYDAYGRPLQPREPTTRPNIFGGIGHSYMSTSCRKDDNDCCQHDCVYLRYNGGGYYTDPQMCVCLY